MDRRNVIICGDGASAVALAHALTRQPGNHVAVTIIGAGRVPGEGVAYATKNPVHLLNAPADKMSAVSDDPLHFVHWLDRNGLAEKAAKNGFVSRAIYAQYLGDLAAECCKDPGGLEVIRAELVGLGKHPEGWTVFHKGGVLHADAVVLATGNDMPAPLTERFGAAVAPYVIENPWHDIDVASDARILTVGTGLTAIDTALTLLDRNHRGPITMLSRRGLLPHTHVEHATLTPPPLCGTVLQILRRMRAALGRNPDAAVWQAFVDGMRPQWAEIWNTLSTVEQRRFLRRGFTLFNIHRHRMAPKVGAQIADAIARGAIQLVRGKIASMRAVNGELHVTAVDGRRSFTLVTDRAVNCTGPNSDPEKSHDTFIQTVIATGFARSGELGLGIDVDTSDRVLDSAGKPQGGLFAMGALTKGRWWEITAMPEIARQAQRIAQTLVGPAEADVGSRLCVHEQLSAATHVSGSDISSVRL